MRNKVIIVRGYGNVAKRITLAEIQRINADHVVVIAALRRPHFLPNYFLRGGSVDLQDLALNLFNCCGILNHWQESKQEYAVLAEYATILEDRGDEVRVVEGGALRIDWFFEAVKTIHRSKGETVVEMKLSYDWTSDEFHVTMDDWSGSLPDAIEMLKPNPNLG